MSSRTPRKIQAVLFDLDGTLIDSTHLILSCFAHAWQTVCGYKLPEAAYIGTMGVPLNEAMRQLIASLNGTFSHSRGVDYVVELLVQQYRAHNTAHHDRLLKSFEEVPAVVSELNQRGYFLGVVTSKSKIFATRGLQLCSLSNLVQTAVCLEDTELHKPDPAPIHLALQRLGVPAASAAYVGDSQYDMLAGRSAGVLTVAALWGPNPRETLERELPDVLAQRPANLLQAFP